MYYLQRALLIALFLLSCSSASATYPGLFGSVVNVASNDSLNVREKPDYHSKKTGSLAPEAFVGVDHCKKMGKSTWCKVFPLPQQNYEGFGWNAKLGWVNARYLKFDNRGYVIIAGKPNCDYALRCKNNKCEVVVSYITNPRTEWIDRKRLKGTDRFGAMPNDPDASGYCTTDQHVEEFLKNQKNIKRLGRESQKVFEILSILRHFDTMGIDGFLNSIHPQKGTVMTWNTHFGGKEDIVFTRSDIKRYIKNPVKKIHWGHTYGKGDKVLMSLQDYMLKLTKPSEYISKIKKLNSLKGFQCDSGSQCKGYEVFWIDENSKTKEYDWQGLVVILEAYHGKWYVVGLLRDRWTI